MGLMIDTNVFIRFEKSGKTIDFSSWDNSQKVYISVVIASELLVGVHRANTEERRQRRSIFVEAVIAGIDILDFTVPAARIHAEIHADLARKGQMIGAHDLIIAATARCHNLSLLTDNVDEFSRVPGLRVIPFALPSST
jgi:predicted nucleic acid-binding protein